MMRHFCTYFDFNFLPRGLALYESLQKNCDRFMFYVLAFDDKTKHYLKKNNKQNVVIIDVEEYKRHFNIDMEKYQDKKQFYFSATPNFCLYILQRFSQIDILIYVDADVYFFNSVEYLFTELDTASIGICPQNLNKVYKFFAENYGVFNVGINAFRNNRESLDCLLKWKDDCESWYPQKPDYPLSFFSDQIFLDKWPSLYRSLKIIDHIGIDAAPWNILNYKVSKHKGNYYVNDKPLIVYHFSTLIKISDNLWNANLNRYFVNLKSELKNLYLEYVSVIESFDVKNHKVEKLNFKSTWSKRFVYKVASFFFNEKLTHL